MRIPILCLLVFLAAGGLADAQVSAPVLVAPRAGAKEIQGSCIAGATVRMTVRTGSTTVTLADSACNDGTFTADTSTVLVLVGSELSGTQAVGTQRSAAASVRVTVDGVFGDEREDFEASAYVGLAIDRFAAQEIRNYLNPAANGVQHERSIFGIDFEYRFRSGADRDNGSQLWVFGETLHGVRSEDIDCKAAPNVPSCQKTLSGFAGDIPESALFMLRNASSLEAFVGARYEFHGINIPGRNPARLYVKGQLGFIEITESDGDAKDMHHVAIGATVVGGPRAGSHLEVGFGRTDLFLLNRYKRFKIDGLFQQAVGGGVNLFAQLFADVDGRDGADAMQSYFGLAFDVGQIVGAIKSQ